LLWRNLIFPVDPEHPLLAKRTHPGFGSARLGMPWVEIPYGSLLALLEPPHDLAPTVWALTQCVAEHFSFRDPERIPEGGRVSSILAFRVQNGRLPGPRVSIRELRALKKTPGGLGPGQ